MWCVCCEEVQASRNFVWRVETNSRPRSNLCSFAFIDRTAPIRAVTLVLVSWVSTGGLILQHGLFSLSLA